MLPRRNLIRNLKKAVEQPDYALQALAQRGKSFLTYHLQDGRSSYPETISCLLTYRCNLRCKMCGQWGEKGSSRNYTNETLKEELSLDIMKSLIDDVKCFRPNITVFGGEPFMHHECLDIVAYIKNAGMRCNIITNGVLLEKNAEAIVDLNLDEIIFSLDGPGEIHDEMRSAKGTFDKAMAGLKSIAEIKKRKGKSRPHVNISTTLFEINYKALDEVVAAAEQIAAKSITFHHLIFLDQKAYDMQNMIFNRDFDTTCHEWGGFVRDKLPDMDIDYLVKKMFELKRKETKLDISFYPNFTNEEIYQYYSNFNFTPSSYKNRCVSPWMVAYIFPDGSVRPCQSLNYSSGNIKKDTFRNIWNNDKHVRFRKITKKNKVYPVCSRCTELYRF